MRKSELVVSRVTAPSFCACLLAAHGEVAGGDPKRGWRTRSRSAAGEGSGELRHTFRVGQNRI